MFKKLSLLCFSMLFVLFSMSVMAAPDQASADSEILLPPKATHTFSSPSDSWQVGGDWGYGVLRTLERGASDNLSTGPDLFDHKNHLAVWGVHVGRDYGLGGHWSLGWRLGYRYLGKTSGSFISNASRVSYRSSKAEGWDGLLQLTYHLCSRVSIFGRLGAMMMQLRQETVQPNRIIVPNDERRFQADPEWQLGLAYQIKQLLLSLSYYRVVGSDMGTLNRFSADGRGTRRDPTASGVVFGVSLMGDTVRQPRDEMMLDSWFLGADWGVGILRTLERGAVDNGNPGVFHHNNQTSVWGAHVGREYRLNDLWSLSLQLGYRYLGQATGSYRVNTLLSERTQTARGWDGLLTLHYHVAQNIKIFGGLGAMAFRFKRKVFGDNTDAYPGSESRTQMDPEFVLGIGYQIKQLLISLSYDRVVGSEVAVANNINFIGRDAHLDPTASSLLIGADFIWGMASAHRLAADVNHHAWVIGGDWGLGVLRTLERGSSDNASVGGIVTPGAPGVDLFDHKNHPSVWGVHVGRDYGLTGRWGIGWRLGFRDLGKTSGSFINGATRVSYRREEATGWDGLFQLDYHLDRHLSVFGGLGAMVMRIRREVTHDNGVAYPGSEGRTQMDPEFLFGVSYEFKQWLLSLSYHRVVGAETGTADSTAEVAVGRDQDNSAYLDPTASSILLGISFKWGAQLSQRLSSDYNTNAWVVSVDGGLGVLRTLERGAGANETTTGPNIFEHKNHPIVWGAHIGRDYGTATHWRVGWRIGYRDLGKTSGSFINNASQISYRTEKAAGWDGFFQLNYQVDRHFSVFGGLGAMAMTWRRNITHDNGSAYPGSERRLQIDPEFLFGASYQIKWLLLSLSYDRVVGSEVGIADQMSAGRQDAHLDPTASSVLVGASIKWATLASDRMPSDYDASSWVIGGDWGWGVLRTLEWGASDNISAGPHLFDHKNHPSVWGVHVGRDDGLGGRWGVGWRVGYRDLGKTSGSSINNASRISYRTEKATGWDGLFRLDYRLDRHWRVFSGLGAMVMRVRREVTNDNGSAYPGSEGRTQIDPEFVLGASYQFKHWVLSLSYDRVMGAETGSLDQTMRSSQSAHLNPTASSMLLGVYVRF